MEEKEEYFFGLFHSHYIQVTSQTVFETKLLDQVTFQVTFSGATFESQALVYNATNGELDETRLSVFAQAFGRVQNPQSYAWKLNQKRLEDAWFLYQLITFYEREDCLASTDLSNEVTSGNRRDIEKLCELANLYRSLQSPKWVSHTCGMKGCREGFAVVDGNEKINRPVRAASKSRVKVPREHIFLTNMCTRSPVNGGPHQNSSKFCALHSHLSDGVDSDEVDPSHPLPTPHHTDELLQKSQVGELPENDDPTLLTGCRKAKGVNPFHERTAGVLSLVRPCGIIVNTTEMYTCESPTQVYLLGCCQEL